MLEVLEETSFRPNAAARTLASGRSGVVGVVMHVDPHFLFRDPYFAQLLQGLSDALAEQEVGMMLWLGNRSKEETLDRIQSIGLLDGVIVTANMLDDPLVDGLLASALPTVLVGHRRADRAASYVDVDHMRAAESLVAHLGPPGGGASVTSPGRAARSPPRTGSRATAGRWSGPGFRPTASSSTATSTGPSGMAGAALLLDAGVDAIFCANDAMAAGALETIRARGLRVPDDVALAGFDDLDFAAHLDPPLTTVRQGVREQGAEAAHTLFQLIGIRMAAPAA